MKKVIYMYEQMIHDKGEIPICGCPNCKISGNKVNVKPDKDGSYIHFRSHNYPKYIAGHSHIGTKRPDISKLMKESNPMWIPEIIEMHSGANNCMKRPEVIAKFMGELNSSKRPEVRKKLVDMWKDPELRERACKANSDSWTQEKKDKYSKRIKEYNPMFDEETKSKHLEILNSENYKRKMSISTKTSWITKPKLKNFGKSSSFYGKIFHSQKIFPHNSPFQGTINMFRWDRLLAKYYDTNNIPYLYEPKFFPLILNGKDASYTPDFYLPESDLYIEVKRYWRDDAEEKYQLFLKTYPDIKIKLLINKDLESLGINLKITPEEREIMNKHKEQLQIKKKQKEQKKLSKSLNPS